MNFVNQECSNQIREKPILENALSRYYLYERKFQKGKMEIKWLYVKIGTNLLENLDKNFQIQTMVRSKTL